MAFDPSFFPFDESIRTLGPSFLPFDASISALCASFSALDGCVLAFFGAKGVVMGRKEFFKRRLDTFFGGV